jgi:hypothetical protein
MASTKHGGPYDRGSADSYYERDENPHYYVGATYTSERVDITDKNSVEYKEYMLGYTQNERIGSHKKWD